MFSALVQEHPLAASKNLLESDNCFQIQDPNLTNKGCSGLETYIEAACEEEKKEPRRRLLAEKGRRKLKDEVGF